jgi:hypothetical protein
MNSLKADQVLGVAQDPSFIRAFVFNAIAAIAKRLARERGRACVSTGARVSTNVRPDTGYLSSCADRA